MMAYSIGCLAYGSIDILANQKSNADAIQSQFIRKIIIVGRSDRALSPESMVNVLILETPVGTQTRNIWSRWDKCLFATAYA